MLSMSQKLILVLEVLELMLAKLVQLQKAAVEQGVKKATGNTLKTACRVRGWSSWRGMWMCAFRCVGYRSCCGNLAFENAFRVRPEALLFTLCRCSVF
jgi:hypothetical protein